MNGRYAPLSPVSQGGGGGEWNAMPRYQSMDDRYDNNNNSNSPASRGQFISPPNSGGSDGRMNMNAFSRNPNGGPSPPPSVARSSNGTNIYARSDSGRMSSNRDPELIEATLGQHYVLFDTFLREGNRDPRAGQAPNKAQDKLLRLSGTQFLELSTDVYDELVRRQALERHGPDSSPSEEPPSFLPPELNFHPKRNQARQKLASLVGPRFRELASDVFWELERRFPRFAAGEIPRAPSRTSGRPGSRSQTPSNGMRSNSRMRKMSDASSLRGPPPLDSYGIPGSPGMPPSDFGGRPNYKPFSNNMIVPNKSTMVEEDDDDAATGDDSFAARGHGRGDSMGKSGRPTARGSEADKKIIDDYQSQVRELREKMEDMEETLRKKDDEINNILEGERSREMATNLEKKEWSDQRLRLENRAAEAEARSDSLQEDMARERDEHANEMRQLRMQLDDAPSGAADPELRRENDELRDELRQQQQVTDEVRREAQQFLREMRQLSQQSGSTWEKQAELEQTIDQLEQEVRDWKGRYAKAKTQLRSMRASSMGLPLEQDASRLVREKGFAEEGGLVKDVHVTKFQISVDELLQKARTNDADKVIDAMKVVVGNVRRITKDVDERPPRDDEARQQLAQAKSKVAGTANHFITASKNFAAAAGLSPVSLLDAAAGHLVAAMIEMLRVVKIRPSPAGELEDDDDGTVTPTESTGFFSQRTTQGDAMAQQYGGQSMAPPALRPQQHQQQNQQQQQQPAHQYEDPLDDGVLPPPPFQGLGGLRDSAVSSAYSPVSSPRQSSGVANGYQNMIRSPPRQMNGYGGYGARNHRADDLKLYLDDQTAVLVSNIQNLVGSIRADADVQQLTGEIDAIAVVVGRVIGETEANGSGGMVSRLADCRQRLLEAGERGAGLAAKGMTPSNHDWRMWTSTLPPIAFEIARETKALVQQVGQLANGDADEFA